MGLGVPEQRVRVPAEVGHKDRSALEDTRDNKPTASPGWLPGLSILLCLLFTPPSVTLSRTVSFSGNALPDSPYR